jgi:opacity protein-like surface antigen
MIAAASAVAIALAAPAAANAASGYVDLSYADNGDFDVNSWAVNGSAVVPAGQLNLQFDAGFTRTDFDGDNVTTGAGAVHLFHRNDKFAVGGVVGVADPGIYTYGLEGAMYLDRVTLSGSASILTDDLDLFDDEPTVLNLGAKFFVTDNVSIGASYSNFDTSDFGESVDSWGLEGEFKTSGPASFFAAYSTTEELDLDTWSIGMRWNFGDATLKARDRSGPSMGARGGASFLNLLF